MSSLEELLDKLWPCRCWYCRLFTRRLLKRYVAKAIVEKPVEEKPVEVEMVSTATPSMDVVKEITELKKGFDELKKAIAEIKALLSDLTGPYSYYKPPEEEKPVKKKEETTTTKPGVGVKIVEKKPETTPIEESSVSESTVPREETMYEEEKVKSPQLSEEKPMLKVRERGIGYEQVKPPTIGERMEAAPELLSMIRSVQEAVKEERSRLASTSLKQTITIIKTLYELRKMYPRSSIEALLKLIEALNIIPREEVELLKTSMEIVEESLKQGVTPDESVILLYMLLKNLGIRDESLEEELTRTMLKTLMMMRKKTLFQNETKNLETGVEGGNNKWASQQQ